MIKIYCLISAVILVIIICAYWYIEHYRHYKSGCIGKITFQKFLEIYEISYWKLDLRKGYVIYYPEGSFRSDGSAFYFSIRDTFRYEHWRKAKERAEYEKYNKKKITEIEKCWEKDMENFTKGK